MVGKYCTFVCRVWCMQCVQCVYETELSGTWTMCVCVCHIRIIINAIIRLYMMICKWPWWYYVRSVVIAPALHTQKVADCTHFYISVATSIAIAIIIIIMCDDVNAVCTHTEYMWCVLLSRIRAVDVSCNFCVGDYYMLGMQHYYNIPWECIFFSLRVCPIYAHWVCLLLCEVAMLARTHCPSTYTTHTRTRHAHTIRKSRWPVNDVCACECHFSPCDATL